jgi:multiple sugar transport system substrate-binding protein
MASPRRRALTVGAVALAVSLAACTSSSTGGSSSTSTPSGSGGVVQITMAHGYTDVEEKAITAQVATWNAAHPKIQVKLLYNGGNDFALQKTLAGIAAGTYPDIAYEYGSSLAALQGRQQVVDLTSKVHDQAFKWNDFYSFERDAATSNGKVYGLPALVDNLALVYNKKLFDQANVPYPTDSWTWNDFRSAAKALTDAGRKQYGWAYINDGSEDTVWRWIAMLWQAGGDLLSSDGKKTAFNSAAGLAATQQLHDMAVTDKSVYLDTGNGNYLNLFNSGKIAMLWTGPWDLSSINSDVQYGVQILPEQTSHASIAGPDNWMLFDNGAARKAAAWEFLTWLTSAQTHAAFTLATGDLPTRQSETQLPVYTQYLAKYPGDTVFVLNLGNVTKARPNIKAYPQISQAIGSQMQGVLIGQTSPQDALNAAAQQSDAALASGP